MNDEPVLIIACGASKREEPSLVNQLYTGTLWKTYRAARTRKEGSDWSGPHPEFDVYVLSAAGGLMYETETSWPYDVQLVAETSRKRGHRFRRVSQLVQELTQRRRGLPTGRIYFVGGKLYREALQRVFPGGVRLIAPEGSGIGDQAAALKRFLGRGLPGVVAEIEREQEVERQRAIRGAQALGARIVDLDAIIARVTGA